MVDLLDVSWLVEPHLKTSTSFQRSCELQSKTQEWNKKDFWKEENLRKRTQNKNNPKPRCCRFGIFPLLVLPGFLLRALPALPGAFAMAPKKTPRKRLVLLDPKKLESEAGAAGVHGHCYKGFGLVSSSFSGVKLVVWFCEAYWLFQVWCNKNFKRNGFVNTQHGWNLMSMWIMYLVSRQIQSVLWAKHCSSRHWEKGAFMSLLPGKKKTILPHPTLENIVCGCVVQISVYFQKTSFAPAVYSSTCLVLPILTRKRPDPPTAGDRRRSSVESPVWRWWGAEWSQRSLPADQALPTAWSSFEIPKKNVGREEWFANVFDKQKRSQSFFKNIVSCLEDSKHSFHREKSLPGPKQRWAPRNAAPDASADSSRPPRSRSLEVAGSAMETLEATAHHAHNTKPTK